MARFHVLLEKITEEDIPAINVSAANMHEAARLAVEETGQCVVEVLDADLDPGEEDA